VWAWGGSDHGFGNHFKNRFIFGAIASSAAVQITKTRSRTKSEDHRSAASAFAAFVLRAFAVLRDFVIPTSAVRIVMMLSEHPSSQQDSNTITVTAPVI
jgi:hypothetical protein